MNKILTNAFSFPLPILYEIQDFSKSVLFNVCPPLLTRPPPPLRPRPKPTGSGLRECGFTKELYPVQTRMSED